MADTTKVAPSRVSWSPKLRFGHKLAIAILLLAGLVACSVQFLPVTDPDSVDSTAILAGLGQKGHLLGTDSLGRDLLSRVLHGVQVSLSIAVAAVGCGVVIGGLIGTIAGYIGGRVEALIMWVVDIFLAFPPLILALVTTAFLGIGAKNVVIALALSSAPGYARFARAEAQRTSALGYVKRARLDGAGSWSVLKGHVVPNIAGAMATYALTMVGVAVLVEAALSFLGLGVRPPRASLGSIISEGRTDMVNAPQLILIPGLVICVLIVSLNTVSDWLISRGHHAKSS